MRVTFTVVCVLLAAVLVTGQEEPKEKKKSPWKSRQKRSVIMLPSNTSVTLTFDMSMPIPALSQNLGFYNMRLPFRFFIPTYNQLTSYYGRESREDQENEIDHEYHRQEQERSNEERRFIYKSIESLLSRYAYQIYKDLNRASIIYTVDEIVLESMEWLAFNEQSVNYPKLRSVTTIYLGTH